MAQSVGKIYYEVTLDTSKMIEDQRRIREELKNTTNSFNSFSSKLSAVSIAVSALAAAMAAVKSAQMADEMRMLAAKVEVAAGSFESGASAMASLVSMSRITQTSVAANAEVFTRLNQSMIQMGGTQADTLRMTELLGKAIRVSGASAVEAKAAMLQFGQAMGSGKLQGDELRSLMETAPYLMQKLAQGIGVPIGALKKLGEEGKLTADVVANAFTKAALQIEADFQKFPQTLAAVMAVMEDAAKRANEKLDELSGVSVAATGAAKGLGDVLDSLADQFGAANTEAGSLGRNVAIKGWADTTRTAISYLVDGADVLWQTVSVLGRNVTYVFSGIGREIGGIVAQFSAMDEAGGVFTSDGRAAWNAVGQAMRDDAERASNDLAAAEKKILGRGKTLGEAMREAWNVGAGGGRGFVNPQQAQSQLKAPKDTAAEKKAADEAKKITSKALAAQVYYDGLVAENKTALEKIDAEEQKALTENQKRRNDDGANAAIYEKAKLEIRRRFNYERLQLTRKTADELAAIEDRNMQASAEARILLTDSVEQKISLIREESIRKAEAGYKQGRLTFEESETAKTSAIQKAIEDQRALQLNRQSTQLQTLQIKSTTSGGAQDQENYVQAKAAADMAAVEAARLLDLENSQIYADQKVAIEAKMHQDIDAIRSNANQAALTSSSDIFGSLASIAKSGAGEQSGIFKALFAAQKAFSIAQSIVSIQTGIANAAALPFPANLGAMAGVAAATASIVSTISGTNISGGRQYGGPVSASNLYRINEKGAPEMFTAANGNQYMMPTASGRVTAADQVGGGMSVNIVVNNTAPGTTATASFDDQSRTVTIAVAEVAAQIRSNSGPVFSAMRAGTNIQPRMG